MKKLIPAGLALLALLLGGTAFAADGAEAAHVDAPFTEAQATATSAGKPILVDFYATW